MRTDVLIIGAGASGMAAGITAAASGKSVLIIEKNDAPGKKIYATGNGRCNIMNSACDEADTVRDFFRRIGLEMKEEDGGRMYPMSDQASDVVFVLERALGEAGVRVMCGAAAGRIEMAEGGFLVTAGTEKIEAEKVIIATGGKAGPMYGTTGDGYGLARSLGHSVGRLAPALTGIETEESVKELKGTRARARVRLLKKRTGEVCAEEAGIVQFTDYGLSGICVFDLSRYILLDNNTDFDDYEISVDLLPDMEEEDAIRLLEWRRDNVRGMKAADMLRTLAPKALAEYISGQAERSDAQDAAFLAGLMKDLRFTVSGMRGWKMAQVTRGGISREEIDEETMESKIAPGLYFAGEITDYDGPCGGFNLHHAWITGMRAGEAAVV